MKTQILTNLPGIDDAILHLTPINPDENPVHYKVTGHTIPTAEMTAAEVMNRFGHATETGDSDGHGYLTIVAKDDAHVELSADLRHGTHGFRANRYELVNPANQKRQWDEWPLFFESLDQAIELFAHPVDSPTFIDGKKAARLRF